jgi:excisionase family DNA binding protein
MNEGGLLTSAQVLELLQIGRTKLWDLVRHGQMPAYRLGAGRNAPLRFRRDEVLRWLEGQRVPHPRIEDLARVLATSRK